MRIGHAYVEIFRLDTRTHTNSYIASNRKQQLAPVLIRLSSSSLAHIASHCFAAVHANIYALQNNCHTSATFLSTSQPAQAEHQQQQQQQIGNETTSADITHITPYPGALIESFRSTNGPQNRAKPLADKRANVSPAGGHEPVAATSGHNRHKTSFHLLICCSRQPRACVMCCHLVEALLACADI